MYFYFFFKKKVVEGFIPQLVNICLMMLMELEHEKVEFAFFSFLLNSHFFFKKKKGLVYA